MKISILVYLACFTVELPASTDVVAELVNL